MVAESHLWAGKAITIDGEVAERLKAPVLKTGIRRKADRGFESLPLRFNFGTTFQVRTSVRIRTCGRDSRGGPTAIIKGSRVRTASGARPGDYNRRAGDILGRAEVAAPQENFQMRGAGRGGRPERVRRRRDGGIESNLQAASIE